VKGEDTLISETVFKLGKLQIRVDHEKELIEFWEHGALMNCLNLVEFVKMIKAVSDAFKTGKA
jgi:rRNA processing protein Krr1/Pno1